MAINACFRHESPFVVDLVMGIQSLILFGVVAFVTHGCPRTVRTAPEEERVVGLPLELLFQALVNYLVTYKAGYPPLLVAAIKGLLKVLRHPFQNRLRRHHPCCMN